MVRSGINEKDIIAMMRNEYHNRLLEALAESDVFDDRGNVVIGKDLKVRHKDSQFEYTVDGVIEDPSTGSVKVVLRLPDEPRFDPPPGEEGVIADRAPMEILDEDELVSIDVGAEAPHTHSLADPEDFYGSDDDEVFTVDQKEFEKEYEVK